ncbi:hypothetical protein F4779DRAFT_630365 [Xylariaceae sp. FL0662B]|nr:hypothetical protein F4779DRAFT_630365 [Xylariaceae sp. FL0662B]
MQTASDQAAQGSGSMPYPPQPASPTLTNPDMILPDYDDTASSPNRSHSPLMMWKNAHANDMQFDLTPQAFTGSVTPTTPIIYGNGTMLSDIGEVTEVESIRPTRKSRSDSTRSDATIQSATPMYYEAIRKKEMRSGRPRRASIDSTSTVTTTEQAGLFADFDDGVSVDDSNFQGDDEESVAESYNDDAFVQEDRFRIKERPRGLGERTLGEERYSTALSRRAEHILANAKRRLTTMEGNLSRARSSLYSPTLSSDSMPSPPMVKPATAMHRHNDSTSSRKSIHGHKRISSENNIKTESTPVTYGQRSSSALGAAGGYRPPPLQSARSGTDYARENQQGGPNENTVHGDHSFARSKPSLQVNESGLEPLSEDGVSQPTSSARTSLVGSKYDFLSPTGGSSMDKGLRRSASTAQMRDLKDQMNDLKGRLSTLRDQARVDSMKRRSLQSLRTPSPFTHARVEQWYADATKYEDDQSVYSNHESRPSNGDISRIGKGVGDSDAKQAPSLEDDKSVADVNESVPHESGSAESRPHSSQGDAPQIMSPNEDDMDDMKTEDGSDEEEEQDGVPDSASESGESAYYDSVQNQVSHEDREDAFDYEHFFLHSAMGSMSQRRISKRGSRESFSSEDSVETTRGPTTSTRSRSATGRVGRLSRRGSAGSISSVETFATATEGRHTRADNSAAEDYPEPLVIIPERARTHTPNTAKLAAPDSETGDSGSDRPQFRYSVIRRPQSSAAAFMHRPSVSSLDSAGTHRSFPLVNRPRTNTTTGVLTPRDSPDREDLKQISEALMSETASIYDSSQSTQGGDKMGPIEMLPRGDQILVQRLVASLGRCVLGMADSGRASAESRAYRRRIEAAKRILEGFDEPA